MSPYLQKVGRRQPQLHFESAFAAGTPMQLATLVTW